MTKVEVDVDIDLTKDEVDEVEVDIDLTKLDVDVDLFALSNQLVRYGGIVPPYLADEAMGAALEAAWLAEQQYDDSKHNDPESYIRYIVKLRLIDFIRGWTKDRPPSQHDPARETFQYRQMKTLTTSYQGSEELERKGVPYVEDHADDLIEREGVLQLFEDTPLSDVQRLTMNESIFEGLPLKEIGARRGVTESRTSQIRTESVKILRRFAARKGFM